MKTIRLPGWPVSQEVYDMLKSLAEQEDQSMASVVRRLVRDAFKYGFNTGASAQTVVQQVQASPIVEQVPAVVPATPVVPKVSSLADEVKRGSEERIRLELAKEEAWASQV